MRDQFIFPTVLSLLLSAFIFSSFSSPCIAQSDGTKSESDFISESYKYTNERKPLEAISVLNRGIDALPSAFRLYFQVAKIYLGLGDIPKMEQAIEAGIQNSDERDRYNAIQSATNILTGAKKCRKSIEMLNSLIIGYPEKPPPHLGLANAHKCLGDKVRALSEINQYLALNPDNGSIISLRNQLLVEIGKQEINSETDQILIEDLEKRILNQPNNSTAKHQLAGLLLRRTRFFEKEKKHEQMFADFDRVVELLPNSSMYLRRGGVLLRYGLFDKALSDFDEAIKELDNVALFYVYRGDAYLGLKRYEEALRDYEKALELGGVPLETLKKKIAEVKAINPDLDN